MIYHETLDFLSEHQVLAALFGDLAIPISTYGRSLGEPRFGGNGAWSSKKNRGVSALRYVRTNESITTVINPWAEHAIDPRAFSEPYWQVDGEALTKRAP